MGQKMINQPISFRKNVKTELIHSIRSHTHSIIMFVRLLFVVAALSVALAQDAALDASSIVTGAAPDATPVAAPVDALAAPADTQISATQSNNGAANQDAGSMASCPFFQPTTGGSNPGRTPYEMLTADAKLDYIWSQLLVNQFTGKTNDPSLVFQESMDPVVHHQSDFMPANRLKVTHSSGVVCKIKLEINKDASPYTGILKNGAEYGVLRWSSTVDPFVVGGPVPSMGMKYFKDGELSANGVALNTQTVQKTSNPLAVPLTNQFVAAPLNIQQRFGTVTGYPNFTGNSAFAYESSNSSAKINFPWQLIYVPNPDMQKLFPEHFRYNNNAEFYSQFLSPLFQMPAGEPILYHVHAVDKPGDMSFYIGDIRMKSPFVRSEFGDKTLFFKHTITEEDIQFRREFGVMCPPGRFRGCSPCPQTYNCVNSDWVKQIDAKSPYSEIYNPRNFGTNSDSSKVIEDIFTIGTDAFIQKYGLGNANTTDINYPSVGTPSTGSNYTTESPMVDSSSGSAAPSYPTADSSSGSAAPSYPTADSSSASASTEYPSGSDSTGSSKPSYPSDSTSSGSDSAASSSASASYHSEESSTAAALPPMEYEEPADMSSSAEYVESSSGSDYSSNYDESSSATYSD